MTDRDIVQRLSREQSQVHVTPGMRNRLFASLADAQTPRSRIAPRRAAALALSLLLFTACACAACVRLGILDFLSELAGRKLPSDAQRYITEGTATFADADDRFSVQLRQMAFDGSTIFAVLDITPQGEAALILPADARLEDPAGNLRIAFDGTIADYCASTQRISQWHASVKLSELPATSIMLEGLWCEDGFYTLYLSAQLADAADTLDSTLEVVLTDYAEQECITVPCAFSLAKAAAETVIGKSVSLPAEAAGITIDRVEIEHRAFETWVSVFYTVTEPDVYADLPMGVEFRVLHASGTPCPTGASGIGITECLRDTSGGIGAMYRSRQSVYMPQVPTQLSLELFTSGTPDTLASFTIQFDTQKEGKPHESST